MWAESRDSNVMVYGERVWRDGLFFELLAVLVVNNVVFAWCVRCPCDRGGVARDAEECWSEDDFWSRACLGWCGCGLLCDVSDCCAECLAEPVRVVYGCFEVFGCYGSGAEEGVVVVLVCVEACAEGNIRLVLIVDVGEGDVVDGVKVVEACGIVWFYLCACGSGNVVGSDAGDVCDSESFGEDECYFGDVNDCAVPEVSEGDAVHEGGVLLCSVYAVE